MLDATRPALKAAAPREVGVGKTVACRAAVATLDASRHTVIYLANPTVGARGLYQAIGVWAPSRASTRQR